MTGKAQKILAPTGNFRERRIRWTGIGLVMAMNLGLWLVPSRTGWLVSQGNPVLLGRYSVERMALLVVLAGSVALFLTSEWGRQLVGFSRESVRETKKVVWPTRKEAMQMTGYVFAFVVVMALFLFLTDKTLEWVLYDLILGWKR